MSKVQNVFLIGAKSLGAYGGYGKSSGMIRVSEHFTQKFKIGF